jgi:hypothetical protein
MGPPTQAKRFLMRTVKATRKTTETKALVKNNLTKTAYFPYDVITANPILISTVRQKYEALAPLLHEKARRCWAASEALALGRGGISLVATATELSRPTIRRGG